MEPREQRPGASGQAADLHAMVFSGSGSSSTDAYEVGAMKALMEEGRAHLGGVPLDPAIYSGSGFGALNAAIMASQIGGDTAATLRYLERVWLDDISSTPKSCGNGVYRLRGNPFIFLDPQCYMPQPARPFIETFNDLVFLSTNLLERLRTFLGESGVPLSERLLQIPSLTPFFDMRPLQIQLRKHVDLERLRRSDKELIVMASDWARGTPRAFAKQEMTDQQGHAILQASAGYLLAFPFVDIGGTPFGGAPGTMATPLKPVIETYAQGTRRLIVHAVFLSPPMADVPLGGKMDSALGGLGRYFGINESVNIRADVDYGSLEGGVSPGASREPGGAPASLPPGQRAIADRGSVTIHRYVPSKPIINWFDFASFDRKKTEGFIAQGYADTRRHDCRTAGCTQAA
ncbi:MAG TPA: patatin-like phospholipase family protein [Thermoanaerobaculia bacterium]|nr:patatin-like phospholipase family protein [Thermoanaerobaculia bacterium]